MAVTKTIVVEKEKESWTQTGWRPLLGFMYAAVCIYDFIFGPTLFNILQYWNPGQDISAYQAVTLQGSGLFHISMAGILGLTTHGRSKEKIANIESSKQ
jgi:hypothetical protein